MNDCFEGLSPHALARRQLSPLPREENNRQRFTPAINVPMFRKAHGRLGEDSDCIMTL
jgi:hypothetical protein